MDYKTRYNNWINDPELDDKAKQELLSIDNENELQDRFYTKLKFGTGGMRGIVGIGENRMNLYTVGKVSSALALSLLEMGNWVKKAGVAISYDCRHMSYEFAYRSASVLCAYGIKVHIYDGLRPVPMLSYAVRHLKCAAGIMITASHNPKEYNGYKVYGKDGAQLEPENAEKVIKYFSQIKGLKVPAMDIKAAQSCGLLKLIEKSVEDAYYNKVLNLVNRKEIFEKVKGSFSIVYTPLHGTGAYPVSYVLEKAGVPGVEIVKSQFEPDSDFSTVRSPNPEETDALERAIKLAKEKNADLVMGTDPDCDRLGAAIRTDSGEFLTLSGNEIGVLLLNYILEAKVANKTLPKNAAVISTIVTTQMAPALCESFNVKCFETLTGFKFICGLIADFEEAKIFEYVFGFEESHGYLPAAFVRDKDAIQACLVMAEMAAWYKSCGMTPYDGLIKLYEKLGYYSNKTVSIRFEGLQGIEVMKDIMKKMRNNLPVEVGKAKVIRIRDYETLMETNIETGIKTKLTLSKSNVLCFDLDDDTSFIARPSGTEPKIKFYYGSRASTKKLADKKIDNLNEIITKKFID